MGNSNSKMFTGLAFAYMKDCCAKKDSCLKCLIKYA